MFPICLISDKQLCEFDLTHFNFVASLTLRPGLSYHWISERWTLCGSRCKRVAVLGGRLMQDRQQPDMC
ncbi:hypothetical protein AAZX31_03G123700 [Glycine max]